MHPSVTLEEFPVPVFATARSTTASDARSPSPLPIEDPLVSLQIREPLKEDISLDEI